MTNNGIKKTAAAIACLIILAAAAVFIIDALSDSFNVVFYPETNKTQQQPDPEPMPEPDPTPEPEPSLVQLAAPEIAYDQETNLLSWSEVDNASGYRVTVNGQTKDYGADTTELEVTIDEGDSYTMSVQALGDGENYSNSEISTITGERENLDQMYYEQIKTDLKEIIEDKTIAYRNYNLQDILNIDYVDNNLLVTARCNAVDESITRYTTFVFEMQDNYTVSSLSDLSEIVDTIKNNSSIKVDTQDTLYARYDNEIDCYNKLIQDSRLTGQLKNYLNDGYTPTMLYSCLTSGTQVDNFTVNSYIKLTKGNDIKVATVKNIVSQKYNTTFSFGDYVKAYIDGTAEDVTIEERSFTEASPVSSIWQAANDKYGSQQAQVTNS